MTTNDDDREQADAASTDWLLAATFWTPTDAHLARIRLESKQIDCLIVDENIVAMQWLWANAAHGIKLLVPPDKVEEARAALERNDDSTEESAEASAEVEDDFTANEYPDASDTHEPHCPKCGSVNVYPKRLARRSTFASILLLGFPLPFISNQWMCEECKNEWTPTAGEKPVAT